MNVKGKLVELLITADDYENSVCRGYPCKVCPYKGTDCTYKARADHLIANGVTVQEWIPASEPPKEPGEYIVAQKHWSDGHLETKKGKWNGVEWLVDGRESLRVAYWMPLPEPPKE